MAAHLIAADRFGHFLGINGLCRLVFINRLNQLVHILAERRGSEGQ
jgi:hypothetical protein